MAICEIARRLGRIAALLALLGAARLYAQPDNNAEPDKQNEQAEDRYREQRKEMVADQIVERGIEDEKVINAMLKVPRHRFVPERLRPMAYGDTALPIGHEQTISQPYIVAFMTEVLKLQGGEKVLEIGTGSGYQAAILAEIVGEVYTIEIVAPLAESAQTLLTGMGYSNIHVRCGDGYQGWQEAAPFDAIIVTCSPDHIPAPLEEQLKVGGKMIIPVGEMWYQELVYLEKESDSVLRARAVLPVRFVPMTGEAEQKSKESQQERKENQ